MEDAEMKEKLNKIIGSFDFSPKYQVDVMGRNIDVPVKYADASAFMIFFSIPIEKAKNILGSDRLNPVRIWGNKCALGVTFFDYRNCSAGPYHEFTFSIPVVIDAKANIPILPMIFDSMFSKFGYYVFLMGADTDIGRKHIEEIFPYPLYDGNIPINLKEDNNLIHAIIGTEKDKVISVRLSVPKSYKCEKRGYNTYYLKDDKIYNVRLNAFSYNKMIFNLNNNIRLDVGNHPIAKILRDLNICPKPIAGIYYKNAIEIASGPEEV